MTNGEAHAINVVLRELFEFPADYGPIKNWYERPGREAVKEAAKHLAERAYKHMAAGIRPAELDGVELRTWSEQDEADLNALLDSLGVEG